MAGIPKRVYLNRRNVDVGGGVDKFGLSGGGVGNAVMLKSSMHRRAFTKIQTQPAPEYTLRKEISISNPFGIKFSSDSQFLAVSASHSDSSIIKYNIDLEEQYKISYGSYGSYDLAISSDGTKIAFGITEGNKARAVIHDFNTGNKIADYAEYDNNYNASFDSVEFSPNNEKLLLYSGYYQTMSVCYNVSDGTIISQPISSTNDTSEHSVFISNDVFFNGFEPRYIYKTTISTQSTVLMSSDGDWFDISLDKSIIVVSRETKKELTIHNSSDFSVIKTITLPYRCYMFAISPNKKHVCIDCYINGTYVLDLNSGIIIQKLTKGSDIRSIVYSPDGNLVAISDKRQNKLMLFNVEY